MKLLNLLLGGIAWNRIPSLIPTEPSHHLLVLEFGDHLGRYNNEDFS
jgi:hypothetical protein